jgi:hypothetical protein
VKQKKPLFIPICKKVFFAERVAVLRSLTATTDWERSEVFTERSVRMCACNGNRKSEALAEQIKNFSVSVPIEVDGWRLSNRQNTSGGLFFFI